MHIKQLKKKIEGGEENMLSEVVKIIGIALVEVLVIVAKGNE